MITTSATVTYAGQHDGAPSLRLHHFCLVLVGCTFMLILAGSLVTTTGSGLAVPDWPTTYGHNMFTYPPDRWVGGIFYEHVHRLIGAGVGLLTILLCVWVFARRMPSTIRWLAAAALLTVCLQGVLGGLTVLLKLPTAVSVAHAGLAEVFFCLTVSLAVLTGPSWRHPPAREPSSGAGLLLSTKILLACVFVQILLGALMRHTQSGLAIPDFPLSYGSVLPPMTQAPLDAINIQRSWWQDLQPVTLAQIWIHFAHSFGGLLVAVAVVWLARAVLRRSAIHEWIVTPTMLLVGTLVMQIVLGALAVWSRRALLITSAHVGVGALMLAVSLVLVLRAYKMQEARR